MVSLRALQFTALLVGSVALSWCVETSEAFLAAPTPRQQRQLPTLSRRTAANHVRLSAAASQAPSLPNPFKKLPWNVKKEQERQARRMKQERAQLHRQLGIAEDATYEEIVAATDQLIAAAGSDMKAKVKIEVAKDKILQHRLNERLAGLQAESKEARAMSTYETEG